MPLKIAILGIRGSNHHRVATAFFGNDKQIVQCPSFDTLVEQLCNGTANRAVMAIENSIAGSIIPNYNLVYHNNLHIIGEHYVTIRHHLMALKGRSLANIAEVHSHPMALLQCKEFFKTHPHIKLVESEDTAEPARRIRDQQLPNIAAIASKMAADLYDLDIIVPDIQTVHNNATRFIILKADNEELPPSEINKASLRLVTTHQRGSLAAVLNLMNDSNLNLTKLQSLPIIETPWKYAFFIDVTFETYDHFAKAKSLLEGITEEFKILGEYKSALPLAF